MLAILLVLYVLQLVNTVELSNSPRGVAETSRQSGLAILFFLFGIARSWQLVGARNVSLASTVTAVIHRPATRAGPRRPTIKKGASTVGDVRWGAGGSHRCSR